jgi:hypothetical protein
MPGAGGVGLLVLFVFSVISFSGYRFDGYPSKLLLDVRMFAPVFLLSELALINVAEGSLGGAGGRLWGKSGSGRLSS